MWRLYRQGPSYFIETPDVLKTLDDKNEMLFILHIETPFTAWDRHDVYESIIYLYWQTGQGYIWDAPGLFIVYISDNL